MTPTKTKIAIGVAAVLGVAALGLIVLSHRGQAQAAAQDNSAGSGGFPNLLFAPSAGPAQIATGSSMQSDPTTGIPSAPDSSAASIMAALSAAQASITANVNTAYNTNATNLIKQLPASLSGAGITDITATISQDASGGTSFAAHTSRAPAARQPTYAAVDAIKQDMIAQADAGHQARFGMSIFDPRSGLFAPGEMQKFYSGIDTAAQLQAFKALPA